MTTQQQDLSVGLDVICENPFLTKDWGKVVLLSNQASVDKNLKPAWKVLQEILGSRLVCLMGPQHGMDSTVQDNMKETQNYIHKPSALKVYSLYSKTRSPSPEMLEDIDTIVIDLQLTGCRVYTFKYTIAACLRMAKKLNKHVVVLDRPNPMGASLVEGNTLDLNLVSFVGEFPIPMRYGLSCGEVSLYFNKTIGADLQIIKLKNWDTNVWKRSSRRSWIYTSPNIPSLESLYCYTGQVLLEGTSVSEGRGTTLPFQLVGSSTLPDSQKLIETVYSYINDGSFCLRETQFQPTFNKHSQKICEGFCIHVLDPDRFPSYSLGLATLKAFSECDPKFQFSSPPYEYNYDTLPIKLITGLDSIDNLIIQPFRLSDPIWNQGIDTYIQDVQDILLYDRMIKAYRAE